MCATPRRQCAAASPTFWQVRAPWNECPDAVGARITVLPGTAVAAATIGAATEVAGAEAARGSAGGGQDRAQAAAMPAIQTMMTAWSRGLAAGGGVGDDGESRRFGYE
mmetsp:Transcript_55876/g.141496  ORF Transcript_55876/g.141496 Transcript_55876/m.141496 type:complete len:108 (+) Transcript_55876:868-1191(+)